MCPSRGDLAPRIGDHSAVPGGDYKSTVVGPGPDEDARKRRARNVRRWIRGHIAAAASGPKSRHRTALPWCAAPDATPRQTSNARTRPATRLGALGRTPETWCIKSKRAAVCAGRNPRAARSACDTWLSLDIAGKFDVWPGGLITAWRDQAANVAHPRAVRRLSHDHPHPSGVRR
jgi:hypothetical protein